jgi:hypothetical protein
MQVSPVFGLQLISQLHDPGLVVGIGVDVGADKHEHVQLGGFAHEVCP